MLSPDVQQQIRTSYQNLTQTLDQFIPRRAQNFLVAEIAKTLAGHYHQDHRQIVAEAGTGIGKSLSYLMASIPVALEQQKKIVISTVTVALQEQLIHKDLPLYSRICERPFSFVLAKGRQRYCCIKRLALAAGVDNADSTEQLALFEHKPNQDDYQLLSQLHQAYHNQEWNGERDTWVTPINDNVWQSIVSDKHSCQPGFSSHQNCPFNQARQQLNQTDVIVANHSLVMADASLGGGIILPEPEKTIYIFDEAHHLARIARDHASASIALKNTASWLEKLPLSLKKLLDDNLGQDAIKIQESMQIALQQLIPDVRTVLKASQNLAFEENYHRFEQADLPTWLDELLPNLQRQGQILLTLINRALDSIAELSRQNALSTQQADHALKELGLAAQRLTHFVELWQLMAKPKPKNAAPLALWLERSNEPDQELSINASPIEVGYQLADQLWDRCAGSVLVSATLRALNSFHYFCQQTGISQKKEDGVQFLALASPFNYQEQAQLIVPAMKLEPQDEHFTPYLAQKIQHYLLENKANLVLFASYWQMKEVMECLTPFFEEKQWLLQVQGQAARHTLLAKHKQQLEAGKTSVLFGTGSFSEGLDLPGVLLENLIITKIPFAVPSSPVEQTHADYLRQRGANPFLQITMPEASKKLVQSVGRLLRKEQDSGRVVILDRRVVSKRYGKALLDALPPFKRIIENQ